MRFQSTSNFQYRAWGGLKAITDGSGHTSSLLYNSKLPPTHFDISNGQVSQNYSYEVVTLTDEVGRQQKVYSDVLGRQWKSEALNWNGTVYSSTTNAFNARDQVTLVRQWAGAEGGGTYQDTTLSYDGYGRLQSKHLPEQNAGTATVYAYNADDTVQSVTDARGASSTFTYNARHLVTNVSYTPSAGVPDTPDASFSYDAAGNRTLMNDGLGSQSYSYDSLSRITSETRAFTGLGNYTIGYQYNLANQLSSITDPNSKTVSCGRDASGRLTSITGTAVPAVPTYASNIQYRAWGAVKHISYNGTVADASFNSRMQTSDFTISSLISKTYEYHADGRLRFSSDHSDHRFDRYYGFDHAGRISEAFSGAEARFEPPTTDRPYRQTFGYDATGHLTGRDMKRWYLYWTMSDSYTNNRRVGWGYDADGRLTQGLEGPITHDAAGRNTYLANSSTLDSGVFSYDGDGRLIKAEETRYDGETFSYITETKHFVRSTVLGGQVLTELREGDSLTYVYAGTALFAREWHAPYYSSVSFDLKDPSGATVWNWEGQQERDPTGADNGTFMYSEIPDEGAFISQGSSYNPANPSITYTTDGIRNTLDNFMARAAQIVSDPFALLDAQFASSNRLVGYRIWGVGRGSQFEITIDTQGRLTGMGEWTTTQELGWWNAEPIYGSSWGQLAGLIAAPQNTQTGADLANIAAAGLSNHPGLLKEIEANTVSGIDVHIVACQAAHESAYASLSEIPVPPLRHSGQWRSDARGADGEIGLLQIFPSTAGLSANALKPVAANVKAGSGYLLYLQNHFNVGVREALAIYNWGPGNFNKVDRDFSRIYSGSRAYADRIVDCANRLFLPRDANPFRRR